MTFNHALLHYWKLEVSHSKACKVDTFLNFSHTGSHWRQ